MSEYELHDIASIWTKTSDEQLEDMRRSIRDIGQTTPIHRWKGKIVDGRHRLIVCEELGIEPKFEELDDAIAESRLLAWAMSQNHGRRHETASQRAMSAARAVEYATKHSEQELNKPVIQDPPNNKQSPAEDEEEWDEEWEEEEWDEEEELEEEASAAPEPPAKNKGDTEKEIAEQMGVSPRSVRSARRVLENASEAVCNLVDNGEISVSLAEKLIKAVPEKKKQAVACRGGAEGVEKAIKAAENATQTDDKDVDPKQAEKDRKKKARNERAKLMKTLEAALRSLGDYNELVPNKRGYDDVYKLLEDAHGIVWDVK